MVGSRSGSGMPVQNIGLVMQLHRRWVLYQLQQMGRAAMSPLSTAKRAVRGMAQCGVTLVYALQYKYARGCDGVRLTCCAQLAGSCGSYMLAHEWLMNHC
jgi:hypothetical protein